VGQEPVSEQILWRKWDCIGHTLRKPESMQHHTPCPGLKPAGQEEDGQASQQLEEIHWGRLIDYFFILRPAQEYFTYIYMEGQQNLGLCSALRAFEQGGIFIVPHLVWHGTSVFPVSSDGPPHSVASYNTRGDEDNLS
jgi:hypothetical protein